MRVQQGPLLLLLTLLTQVTRQSEEIPKYTYKCCGVNEQLDSSGRCVNASWEYAYASPRLANIGVQMANDESWMKLWFPPGPARDRLVQKSGFVVHSILSTSRPKSFLMPHIPYLLNQYHLVSAVSRSYYLVNDQIEEDWTRSLVMHEHNMVVFRPQKKTRWASYCVDSIRGDLAPYAVVFRPLSREGDRFSKCCRLGEVLASPTSGSLQCIADSRAWTTIWNSSLAPQFDAEIPFRAISESIDKIRYVRNQQFLTTPIPSGDHHYAQYIQQHSVEFLSSTWLYPCVDLKREENGDLTDVFGYFLVTRHTRAAYMISRHLSFVSTVILCAALVAIATKKRMRSSAHGWALGCHTVCLLLFNIGQIVYYFTLSDLVNGRGPTAQRHEDIADTCLAFAIPMYFLLSSANAWMTAVCANMFLGFKLVRKNQGAGASRAAAGERRRFLKLSAFAWSVAAALTAVSVTAFLLVPDERTKNEDGLEARVWYRPTFTETRTCYMEVGYGKTIVIPTIVSQKLGTTVYYYVPTLALVAANCVFLCLTGLKVRYLRRGNSLLKKDEREGGGRTNGGGRGQQNKGTSEPKSVTVYIKLLLAGGIMEFLADTLTWAVSSYQPLQNLASYSNDREFEKLSHVLNFHFKDHMYAHRVTGYWADLFRALAVLWLAVPEPPDLRAFWRRMRGEEGDSPAQGAATRPAPRPAARHAPRRSQQESAL